MRIIAGSLKGRSIDVPRNFKGRPTTDFAREGLFNVLNNRVNWEGLKVLDLFAGTGAFSLECFSRGAAEILAIDLQPLHVRFINENFMKFGADNAHAIKCDVFKWTPNPADKFDLIFADPPYDLPGLSKIPQRILNAGILNPEGLLVIEHGKRTNLSELEGFQFEKTYSNVNFSFFGN
ncbi:MAG: RsmD family RNA methyltransferase [Flavobacteriales bacterium]